MLRLAGAAVAPCLATIQLNSRAAPANSKSNTGGEFGPSYIHASCLLQQAGARAQISPPRPVLLGYPERSGGRNALQ